MSKLYIIHEFGAPHHYLAAVKQFEFTYGKTAVIYVEFSFLKLFLSALINLDRKKLTSSIRSSLYLLYFLIYPKSLENRSVILGCAPFDWRLLILRRIVKSAKLIFHSSWLDWSGNYTPKKNRLFSSYIKKAWKQFIENDVNFFAVVTPQVKYSLLENYTINPNIINVVYHSFETSTSPIDAKDIKYDFCYVGRLVKEKGIPEIIDYFKENGNYSVLIIGEGDLENAVASASEQNANIDYRGFVKEKKLLFELYSTCKFLLLPSKRNGNWQELFGMVIIEGMSRGLIPVVTDHVGPVLILGDSQLKSNIIKETEIKNSIQLISDKYLNDPVLFEEHKKEAIAVAEKFKVNNAAKFWVGMF